MDFDDKTVLVTGGAKRIGRAICQHLADLGATVVVHANTSMSDARALAKELGGHAVQADLGDPAQAEALLSEAQDAAGSIDHVVHNASTFQRATVADATAADLDAMMHLHAWAPWAIDRQAAALGATSVVHVLDTRITAQDPHHVAYLLSKQALAHLTRTLAVALAPMRVNGVAPGPILEPNDGSGGSLDAAVDATVLGRPGSPEEVAAAVAFMLDAPYTTGDVLFVDGGRHLR